MSELPGTNGRRRVYLLRHGAVDYFDAAGNVVASIEDVPLSEQGRADAAAAAGALADIPFDRAYCTPYPRTRQTGEIVLGDRELPLVEVPDLHEIDSGHPECASMDEYERAVAYTFEDAHREGARMVGGETFRDAERRVLAAFEPLLVAPGWTRMLVAAHGGVNRLILCWACGAGLAGIAAFEQDPGCINVIDVDVLDGAIVRRTLRAVNVTPANPAKDGVYLTNMEEVFQPVRRLLEGGADLASPEPPGA